MKKELKNNFTQTMLGTILWITLLTSFFSNQSTFTLLSFWKIIIIGGIFGLIFGILYPFLWNYSTCKSITNIFICTITNASGGFLSLYLYSSQLFSFVQSYIFAILVLTLIGHIVAFYFYSKIQNRKLAQELNNQLN